MKLAFLGDSRNIHLRDVCTGLARRGHDVGLISRKLASIPGVRSAKFVVPTVSISNLRRWERRRRAHLEGIVRDVDAVVVFFLDDWGFDASILAKGCVIVSPRGSDITPPPGEEPATADLHRRRVELLRGAARVGVSCFTFAKEVARFANLREEDIDRLPLGVDLVQFSGQRKKPENIIGFIKGFRAVYGAMDLVRAARIIVEKFPGLMLEMLGEGVDLEPCKVAAESEGIADHIVFPGRFPREQMPRYLSRYALTVMPSHRESFGLSALESQAMNAPVVAYRVGGLTETIRCNQTGVLVAPGSVEALADGVVALLQDQPRREEMGRRGREFVAENYEWGKVLVDWETAILRARDAVSIML